MNRWIGSIFWLSVGLYVAIKAYFLGLGSLHHPGAGFIFFVAAILLIILSFVDLASSLAKKPERGREKEEYSLWRGILWQKVLLVVVGLSTYIFFYNFLGFFVSTFLLMILLFKGVEFTKWWIAIGSSIITILISYFIFEVWLEVPFPAGILGF